MSIDFYYILGSPPCYALKLLVKTLGLEVNMKLLDFDKGELKTPEFLKLNPQHAVPTINDNGFVVTESRAIFTYLIEKYAKDDSLYPKDLKKRTLINQRLYFDIGTIYQAFLDYYISAFHTGKFGGPEQLAKLEDSFKILDTFLDGNDWVAGKDINIADYAIASSVASIVVFGFELSKYPNVSRWYTNIRKALPEFDDIIGAGAVELEEYMKPYLK